MGGVVAGAIAVAVVLATSQLHATPYDNFVLLAQAFLHGRVWIDYPGAYIDALPWAGKYYVIEAPLPAVLLLPAVAIFGSSTDQSVLAALLAGVATGATWELARRVGTGSYGRVVLCGFFMLGTDLMWCATFGDVWFIAHVASVAFTMLALLELAGARPRGWLVAIFAACAVESRFAMVVALPIYAALLWTGRLESRAAVTELAATDPAATEVAATEAAARGRATRRRSVASFAAALAPFAALWVAYNYARWGVPYDIGYTAWYHQDSAGQPDGSPFRLSYFPMQVRSFFVQPPDRLPGWPYLSPSIGGTALTYTSPALVFALLARGPWRTVGALWLLALAAAAPNFVYYVNGYAQFGMRHALDFEPFLIVLMALAFRSRFVAAIATLPVVYSMAVGAWGIWYWKVIYRHP